MNRDIFKREIALIGEEAFNKISDKHVAVFGLGGVGSYVCEILVRSGIKEISLIDFDKVDVTNINRQLIATTSTIGMLKTDVTEKRLLDINPSLIVHKYNYFVGTDTINLFPKNVDYIVDAIDNITGKLLLIEHAKMNNLKILSSMGTGNKLNPLLFKIADINQTKVCPLARVIRQELKKRNIKNVKVLYSEEEPIINKELGRTPASISFTPSVAGILIAREVILDLINEK